MVNPWYFTASFIYIQKYTILRHNSIQTLTIYIWFIILQCTLTMWLQESNWIYKHLSLWVLGNFPLKLHWLLQCQQTKLSFLYSHHVDVLFNMCLLGFCNNTRIYNFIFSVAFSTPFSQRYLTQFSTFNWLRRLVNNQLVKLPLLYLDLFYYNATYIGFLARPETSWKLLYKYLPYSTHRLKLSFHFILLLVVYNLRDYNFSSCYSMSWDPIYKNPTATS